MLSELWKRYAPTVPSKHELIEGSSKKYSMSTLPYPREAIIAHIGGWELWRSKLPGGTTPECTLWIGGHAEARHGWRRLRSIKHPRILKYIDGGEVLWTSDGTASAVVMVTEAVTPLDSVLDSVKGCNQWMHWMGTSLDEALVFLDGASIQHNHLCTDALFVTAGGELRMGLFDHSTQGPQPNRMTLFSGKNWKEYPSLLTEVAKGMEGILVMSDVDRHVLYGKVERGLEGRGFPECFIRNKLVNDLIAAQSTGSGQDNEVGLRLVLKMVPLIGQRVFNGSVEEFLKQRLLEATGPSSTTSRLGRAILSELPPSEWLSADTVKVLYNATVEEQNRSVALKALVHLIPRLSQKVLNGDLLRVFSVYQSDADPSIRLGTLHALRDTLPLLNPKTHKQVAGPAFSRSLRDADASVRLFAAQTLLKLSLDPVEVACHVMPIVCTCLIDTDSACRAEAQILIIKFARELEGYTTPPPKTDSVASYSGTSMASMGAMAQSAVSSLSRRLMDVVLPDEEQSLYSDRAAPNRYSPINDASIPSSQSSLQSSTNDAPPKSSSSAKPPPTKLRLTKKTHQ